MSTEHRDDVPLADLEEQQQDLEAEPDLEAGEGLPDAGPHPTDVEANEADVLEQSTAVTEDEDYPRDTGED